MSTIPGPENQTPPAPPLPVAAPPRGLGRNPWAAAALGFLFPGLGQIANGQISKALLIFAVFFGSITIIVNSESPLPWAFLLPLAFFYGIVDAFRSAAAAEARQQGIVEEDQIEGPGWGIGLVVMGVVLLLHNLGWLELARIGRFWPLLLIVAGVVILRNSLAKRQRDSDGGSSL
jgi:TM2 domain-containing membrane protein YozV